jgi:hypothetical protein
MPFDVFISYSHQDKAVADAACSALEAAGIRCWIAPRDVAPGVEWAGAIVSAIDHCRAMVVIFSSGANQSKQIYREVQRAFEKELPVIPLRIENVTPESSLAYYMGPVHWLDAMTPPLENHLKHLVTSVSALFQPGTLPEQGDGISKQYQEQSAGRVESHAQPPAPSQSPPSSSPKWILAAAGIIGIAIIAAAGLWSYSQRLTVPVAGQPTSSPPASPPPATTLPAATPPAATPPASAPITGCSSPICGNWQGVGNTASVQFGGAPYCKYVVTLQKPALSVGVDELGRITKALLSLTMVEGVVGSCAFQPIGTRSHTYLGGGTTNGTKVLLGFNPAPENQPAASATFSGEVINGRLVGSLTVHRTENRAILAWTVQSSTQ